MNKRQAKDEAINNTRSIGELKAMVVSTDDAGKSAVNPRIPKAVVLEIYTKALAGRADTEVPKGLTYDIYKDRMVPSADSLLIRNILRDCA